MIIQEMELKIFTKMTIKSITFLFLFLTNFAYSQQKIWLDQNGNQTSREKASYYRGYPKKVKKGYWITTYYKNGKKYKEGFSTEKNVGLEFYHGIVKFYYENGNLLKKVGYKNNVLHGIQREYFESGELKTLFKFKNGKEDGVWKSFHKSGKIKTKGKYKDGEKVGVWKTFYKNVY